MTKQTTILVVGATSKTGRLLVEKLLNQGCVVRAVVHISNRLSADILNHPNIELIESSILEIEGERVATIVKDCNAVISCLRHVLSFKRVFGEPKKLCAEATQRLCDTIKNNNPIEPVKLVLMNKVGVSNPNLNEKRTWIEKLVLTLLYHLLTLSFSLHIRRQQKELPI